MSQKNDALDSVTDDGFNLWRSLNHTTYLIFRLRKRELAQYGLTPEQTYILDILNLNSGTTTINAIAEKTARQHHSISTQLERMDKRRLVKRIRSLDDQRKYEIVITGEGLKLFRRVSRESVRMVLSALSEGEKRELHSSLRKLRTRVDALTREEPGHKVRELDHEELTV
ncbi:MAG: MarR family transcriptional regulator [Dehalococcoidales bacterium]|nr:MarR family transcriptional regulator [Dehalococcoidales bacterium]